MTATERSFRGDLRERIRAAAESTAFSNYLETRELVIDMLEEGTSGTPPSAYWQQELAGFDYMLDASPLVVTRLREHCFHLTGLRSYEYRPHHVHQRERFAEKRQALGAVGRRDLFVAESRELGGFGHDLEGDLVNLDTLKFYECMIAMDRAGLLKAFGDPSASRRRVVLEIGGGWGGLAYQFKTLFPHAKYVLIDLPQTLLFSGTYLKTLFPDSTVYVHDGRSLAGLSALLDEFDIVLLPDYILDEIPSLEIDVAINTVSFQEMTSAQVRRYAERLREIGCRALYSLNRDRSGHNAELDAVSKLLAEEFSLTEIEVLEVPYTSLSVKPKAPKRAKDAARGVARVANELRFRRSPGGESQGMSAAASVWERPVTSYRHLVGRPR